MGKIVDISTAVIMAAGMGTRLLTKATKPHINN